MTPRVRAILDARWESAAKPQEGWIWPAATKSEHVEPSTLKKQHTKAIKASKIRPFVLYTLRHTFLAPFGRIPLPRLDSRADRWSQFHRNLEPVRSPSADRVLDAMALLGGHKTGHSEKSDEQEAKTEQQ